MFKFDGDLPRDVDSPTITPWIILYFGSKVNIPFRLLPCLDFKSHTVEKVVIGW